MTLKEFQLKAVEGGWKPKWLTEEILNKEDVDGFFSYYFVNRLLLDPLAWQAVGKVEGWVGRPVSRQESDWGYDHWCRDCDFHIELNEKGNNESSDEFYKKYLVEEPMNGYSIYYHKDCPTPAGWKGKMHLMIDALCEGKTIEQFLSTL